MKPFIVITEGEEYRLLFPLADMLSEFGERDAAMLRELIESDLVDIPLTEAFGTVCIAALSAVLSAETAQIHHDRILEILRQKMRLLEKTAAIIKKYM